jgi:heme exporter protein D
LACITIIRRIRLGRWLAVGITASAFIVAIMLAITHLEKRTSITLAFAGTPSGSLSALSERVLEDAPLVGTGAGSFGGVAPIYREADDPPSGSAAATAAATLAIEVGAPLLWLAVVATVAFIITLLRTSLQRRRDSFYPAVGGACLITLLLLVFINAGPLGAAPGLILAATLGLALAQSQSRMPKLGRSAA